MGREFEMANRSHITLRCLASAVVAACLAGHALGQDVIQLRQTVRLAKDQAITLGVVAELSGPDAQAWKDLAIAKDPFTSAAKPEDETAWGQVSLDDVREALEHAPGVRWEKIILRGSTCDIGRVVPEKPKKAAPAADPTPSVAPDGPTVRILATTRLATLLEVSEDDLRVEFMDQDAKLLDTPTTGRIVELQPIAKSDRMAMSVRVYEGEKIVADGSFRAKVQVRRDVLVTRDTLSRGDVLTRENTQVESRWIGATETVSAADVAIGQTTKGKLRPGQMVTPQDIQPAVVVHKGDLVSVDCLSGSIVLRRTMRALDTARDGETIDLQALTGKNVARARMNGVGRAVMLADGRSAAPRMEQTALSYPTSVESPSGGADEAPQNPASHGGARRPAASGGREVQVGGLRVTRGGSVVQVGTETDRIDSYTRLADSKIEDTRTRGRKH